MNLNRFAFYARTVCKKMSGTGFSPDIFHAIPRPPPSRHNSMEMSALSLRCLLHCARWLIMSCSSRPPSQPSLLPRLPNRPSVQETLPQKRAIQLGQFSVVWREHRRHVTTLPQKFARRFATSLTMQIFKQQNAGSSSNSTTQNSLRTYGSEEEMQFDAVFE